MHRPMWEKEGYMVWYNLIEDKVYYKTISEKGYKFVRNNAQLEMAGERIFDAISRC